MNSLINFLDLCLRNAKTVTDRPTREKYYNQAFGALQYHTFLYPDSITYAKVENLWNDVYRPQFENLVYGV